VAVGLLGAGAAGAAGRCLLFVGGPVTEGPGCIVSKSLEESVRQHKDVSKETAPHYKKAKKFYEGLSAELVKNGHVMDIFACALDQVGVGQTAMRIEMLGFGTGHDRKWPLNEGQIPNVRGVRAHASTGYNRVEGNRRASRNGRVSELPKSNKRFAFSSL
jgi:hypothetical protein